ncbi:DUF302 domain-containing protein [Bordetella pseudohinzii]|uniref:Uncharacterized conserved protein n=1 Tax=Bordetella pseudohinzii TaxID=1331258 RepID=A0A0J6BYI4_9BORD|nr:DUF302 domain-containing protein [Bordetella pseudohinzii]ANY18123.1 hypothetical protein BBN53_00770 [Bordetella pseudohinzii]KMM26734.1 hypothetical protein L540_12670 [Bordetella pseudohinzii]KXA79988.1 hypothetical protein AW877_07950 [Bordetella pseudohinzii]KXA81162.1 hypothetical protein AW878_05750 [Bordetella pseudohinzii]CUI63127.1 Uncharacterized conserved protein [Bordetella pseudohinzii]
MKPSTRLPLIRRFIGGAALALAMAAGAQAHDALVKFNSARGFDETVTHLRQGLVEQGMTIFAEIDHAGAAKAAGLAMPPAKVLIFGNPKAGTPLMLAAPDVALDLPLRVLVREQDGRVEVLMHPMANLGLPAGLQGRLAPVIELVGKRVAQK